MAPTAQNLRALVPVGRALHERAFGFRQRLVLWVVAVHLPVLCLVGLLAGESLGHVASELLAVAGLAVIGGRERLNRPVRVVAATTALVACSSLLVHLTGGLIESHFHFFAVVAFVTLYQSWLPFLTCIGWVVVHHGVVGVLSPESVYNHPSALQRPVLWALIHGGFVLLASLASLAAWRLSELERLRAESILAASAQPTYGIGEDGRIVFANEALATLLGRRAGDILGEDHHALLHPAGRACAVCDIVGSGSGHKLDQVEIRAGDDSSFPAELHARSVHERGRRLGAVVTFWDISERIAHRRELEQMALTDSLTGLANRTLLRDRLAHACQGLHRSAGSVAIVYVDLDRFKSINDALGHRAGDELLTRVGARLRDLARPGDTVARVGGDEFVVVCPEVSDAGDARRIAVRLVEGVSRPFVVETRELIANASVGVRLTSDPGEDPDQLVADADLAMFSAKARGGGQVVVYTEEMRERVGDRLTLGRELHRALEAGELILHYQPIWRVDELRPVGVEALLRWEHPVHGLLYPSSFVGLAEETGMIGPIGAWVMTEAVRQLDAWHSQLPALADLHMSINLSVRQLRDPALVEQVRDALAHSEVEPDRLCLEITETVLMQEGDGTSEVLADLRSLGVTLAIDDFGTGFSSLATLRRLPVNQLKIDRSFVKGLDTDGDSQEVVRAIVGLAHALELSVVAEGVERPEELQAVRALSCDHAQGFGLARPVPADRIAALLTDRERSTAPA